LERAIYGLVQAARQWRKKFKGVLKELSYNASRSDPCLFIRKEENNHSYLIIYVDYGGFFNSKDDIKEVLQALGKHFVVKDLGEMKTFVGCEILNNKAKDTVLILQPKLIQQLKEQFGSYVES
jgi:Reverse transcriptase (RNA-dependent DNA polymerase)